MGADNLNPYTKGMRSQTTIIDKALERGEREENIKVYYIEINQELIKNQQKERILRYLRPVGIIRQKVYSYSEEILCLITGYRSTSPQEPSATRDTLGVKD